MAAHVALDRALRAGDLAGARAALGDPPEFPNLRDPYLGHWVLQDALYVAPVTTVEALLDLGADPGFDTGDGFPALALVLHHRDDHDVRAQLVGLLLAHGANPDARGLNDWTPLHFAAAQGDRRCVELLLDHGADPSARTRIDDLTTPAEDAGRAGHHAVAAVLRAAAEGGRAPT